MSRTISGDPNGAPTTAWDNDESSATANTDNDGEEHMTYLRLGHLAAVSIVTLHLSASPRVAHRDSASTPSPAGDSLCGLIRGAYVKSLLTPLKSHEVRRSTGALSTGPKAGEAMISGAGSCKYVREEPVNGETASVYQMEDPNGWQGAKTTTLIWISKANGLPLRQEQDADFGTDGKGHESLYFNWAKK